MAVTAIIGILSALLLPALSNAREKARRAVCLSNERQLDAAWRLYSTDANEKLPLNEWDLRSGNVAESPSNSWVTGNAMMDSDPATLSRGTIFPYEKSILVYRCPTVRGCISGSNQLILRSYSLSCFLGGPQADTDNWGVKPAHQTGQITGPAQTLTFIDEDDSTVDDGHFLYSGTFHVWFNIPSWRHAHGDTLAFADGHVEYWKWRSDRPDMGYFQGGGTETTPSELQDIVRVQQTALNVY